MTSAPTIKSRREKTRIVYQTFDINEIMLTKIEKGHEDFDVVCPSEYIIERMFRRGLLLPIDTVFARSPNYMKGVAPYIRAQLDRLGIHVGHGGLALQHGLCQCRGNVYVGMPLGQAVCRKDSDEGFLSRRLRHGVALCPPQGVGRGESHRSRTDERLFACGNGHGGEIPEAPETQRGGLGSRFR